LLIIVCCSQVYYEYFNHHIYRGAGKGKNVTVPAPLETVPLLIRGGSILPTRERPRRSSQLMKRDPFTLTVALDTAGSARGELYLDDGESFAHESGQFVWREFVAGTSGKTVRVASTDLGSARPTEAVDHVALATYDVRNAYAAVAAAIRVEKLVVVGLTRKPSAVKLASGGDLDWEYTAGVAASTGKEGQASRLVVKNPVANIAGDWEVVIHL
jgi:mannosyl-oligosaccharide alpha-1,3-glucosidase